MAKGKVKGPSPKQIYWIQKSLAEREVPASLKAQAAGQLTITTASELLTQLFKCPKITTDAAKPEGKLAEPGYYVVKNDSGVPFVYVVVEGKNGRRVAKRLVVPETFDMQHGKRRAKWVYAKGAVYKLAEYTPVTVEEAAEFGHLHGYCLVGGEALDNPLSVEVGIGPVCIKKAFGMTQHQYLMKKGAA